MAELTDQAKEMIDKKTFAHVGTLAPDGSPHVTPVWIDRDGDEIIINTAEGRLKPKHLRKDPRVSISMTDPDNPYSTVTVRGHVEEITEEGADDHADAMAKKYLDQDKYPFRQPGEQRLKVRIKPDKVSGGP